MKHLLLLLLTSVTALAADIKVTSMTQTTSPSTNSWLYVVDANASPADRKYLLTNLVTVATKGIAETLIGPGGPVVGGNMLMWADTTGTNVGTAVAGIQYIAPWGNGELNDLKTGTLTVTNEATFLSTVTMDTLDVTTLTADNWVLPVAETNKLVGIGISTNPVVATEAMFTNTIGRTISGTGSLITASSTDEFTNKTLDAAGTGNVLKQTKYMTFMRPDWGDGAGAVPQTNNYTATGLMHYSFSGNQETNANYVLYEAVVPPDIDTAVDMKAVFGFKSGGTDTDTVTWHIAYGLGVVGSAYPNSLATAATSPLAFGAVTPTTPASGDYQETAELTLTGWAASMTAGKPLIISIRRLQDSNDDAQTDVFLRISYGSTQ